MTQTEAEIKEKAEQLFLTEQYVDATPLFLRLLSLQPRDFDYNFKYGTCLLFNSNKKQDAIRYLSYSVKDANIDSKAFFFLGKAYHLNYQFNDAIREYQAYQTKAGNKGAYFQEASRNMEMCRNGKKLLSTITEIIVTKKTEIKNEDFFRIYDLSNIGGSIVVAKDFQSKNDKKYNHIPIVHFPQGTDKIFYSSYGENNQKDIYMVRRLPDGKFSLPQLVQGSVNSSFDEDYPYMHPSGNYLYFSSKGHNSMGGFDVFRSPFNEGSNSFGAPENIDFAISSPDDDILYMVDKDDKNAYFASARQSQDGKLYVYQVMVDRVPIQLAIVKGTFNSSINPENKKMTVEVIDKLTDKSIGVFNTAPDGGYLITFPKGGKYEYQLTIEGKSEKFISQVEIPYLKEFKPLKQKVVHETNEGGEIVRVVNLFNEEVEDAQSIIAQVLKERSELNVNVNQFDLEKLSAQQDAKKILAEIGLNEMSLFEVGELLENKAVQLSSATSAISNEQSASNAYIVSTVEEIKKIDAEVKNLVKEAEQSESDVVQYSILKEAQELVELRNEKMEAMNEIQSLQSKLANDALSTEKKKEFSTVASEIAAFVEAGNEAEALKLMSSKKEIISTVIKGNQNGYEAQLIAKIETIDSKLAILTQNEITYSNDIEVLEAEIRSLTEEKGNVKEKFQTDIQSKIDYKQAQLNDFKTMRESLRTKQTELAVDRKSYVNELEMIRDLKNYSGESVSNQTAESSKKNLSNENANTLSQYIDNQINELVEANPTLANGKGELTPTAKLIAEHNVKTESILANESTSEKIKKDELIALNNQTDEALDARLENLRTEIENDRFNEVLRKELSSLESFSKQLENETTELVKESNLASSEQTAFTKEKMEEELFPTYSNSKNTIASNINLSEKEKLTELNKIDEEYQSIINQELLSINEELAKAPSNASLIAKKETLLEQNKQLKNELEARSNELALLSNETTNESNVPTKTAIVEEVDPAYLQKTEAINENTSLSAKERMEQLQTLDNAFVTKLKNELETVENALERSPNNESLKKEQALLNELIEEKNSIIEARNDELAQLNEQNEQPISKETLKTEITNRISSSHETMVESIENSSLSEEQKSKELVDIHSQFLTALKRELEAISTQLDNNPTDTKLLNEVAVLNEMVDNQEAIIEKLKSTEIASTTVETPISKEALKTEITNRIASSHETMVESIENSSLSEEQKAKELADIHSQFLTALKRELDAKSTQLEINPMDSKLLNEVAVLNEMVDNQETIIEKLKSTEIASTTVETPISKEELVAEITNRIASSHETMVESIENSSLSEEQKAKELADIHSQFLTALKRELDAKSTQLEINPTDSNLLNEVAVLNEMVDNQTALVEKMKTSTNETTTVETPTSKEVIIASIDPTYDSEIAEFSKLPETEKYEQLIKRENELQTKMNQTIADLEAKATLTSEEQRTLAVLSEELQASNDREADYKEQASVNETTASTSEYSLEAIQNDVLKENTTVLTDNFTTIEELKNQELILAEYQASLENAIEQLSKENKNQHKAEIASLSTELEKVKTKRRSVSVTIGEIETSLIASTTNTSEKIESIQAEEEQLKMQLNDTQLSESERKAIQKELVELKNERLVIENPIIASEIEVKNAQIDKIKENNSSANNNEVQQLIITQEKVNELIEEAENQKSEQAKNYLLKEAESLQNIGLETYVSNGIAVRSTEVARETGVEELSSKEALETKKRQYSVQIGDITQTINELENERQSAKSKEKAQLNEQISNLEVSKEFLEKEVSKIDERIAKFETTSPVIAKESINTEITFEEEFEIASSANYENYAKAVAEALEIENQLTSLDEKMAEAKRQLTASIEDEVLNQSDNSEEINEQTERIRTFSVEIGELQTVLEKQKTVVVQATPNNETERMKFENLVLRGINPIKKALIATALIPLPANGIEINSKGLETTYTVSNPIPVNVEAPSGLVYRVQVGAFARPIPQDLFKEFTPVSGEKIANSNITRYMAGYFNNSQKVVDAREQIKALGYTDAFIVAYCDGKRISFGEARNLESSGQCIPKSTDELLIEVAENTALNIGVIDDTTKNKPVNEYAYNQAPGAAKAQAIEQVKGLFYTVQIGVYNKPVSSGHFLNIEPLNTLRLPNGQIRYSTGMYKDFNSALTKQNFVRSKGLEDAFVTAYYNSERITLKEALELIEQKGETILVDTKNSTTIKETVEDKVVQNSKQIEVFEKDRTVTERKQEAIQIVTKKTFTEYPRDVLNRYNAKGSFYYDTKDGKVKSVIYDSKDKLPHVHGFKDDIDTVYHVISAIKESSTNKWIVRTNSDKISGDVADWLLKLNYRRDIIQTENGLEIHIFDVSSENVEQLSVQLSDFNLILEENKRKKID